MTCTAARNLIHAFLDGELDQFMEAYLKWQLGEAA